MAAGYLYPARRPLHVFPFDPMIDRAGRCVVADVSYEKLNLGPSGRLIEVVDYDATRDHFYEPVDLDHPSLLVGAGLAPDESDPRFHQQMVYAVSMRVLESFERALGRPFRWRGDRRLRIYPHAFEQQNAYFDPDIGRGGALLFGYFTANKENPGENIPNQTIFTCLTHAIIAHETTHAVLHRLRSEYDTPTNLDVFGFHEGFADIVAMLTPFTYHDVVAEEIQASRSDLASGSLLLELAPQFGFASGSGKALRTALDEPKTSDYSSALESHERGQVLAAAVMDGFLRAYKREASSIIRLATSGQGISKSGSLHPDLVTNLAKAATKSANRILNMCIRALDYVPPVDITFSDYLRAVVTADADLYPRDDRQLRAELIEGFRIRGIYPTGVTSLAERSLRMEIQKNEVEKLPILSQFILDSVREFERQNAAQYGKTRPDDNESAAAPNNDMSESASHSTARKYAPKLHAWAFRNRTVLGLEENRIRVAGFHVSQRPADDGYIRTILSFQFTQTGPESKEDNLGGIRPRGGTTVVADSDGHVRYIIKKQLPRQGNNEMKLLRSFVQDLEHRTPSLGWDSAPDRIIKHFNLRGIDAHRF